ncbi:unnamed protein product [Prorocentrum cordatum]|uniref:Peptidase C1A papain C-terminal domain-containing protein n=1 Tax=Prorocentrum cordatum TaxID=2364126 RepID=A0ABN9Y957_9DINO|nr:unnamed protein product [Polarella glacialis]
MEANKTVMNKLRQALDRMNKTSQAPTLSSQTFVSCTRNPRNCGGTGGCGGATVELAFDMIKDLLEHGGIPLAVEWPYESGDGSTRECRMDVFKKASSGKGAALEDRRRLYLQGALRAALEAKGFRWVESFAFSDEGELKGKERPGSWRWGLGAWSRRRRRRRVPADLHAAGRLRRRRGPRGQALEGIHHAAGPSQLRPRGGPCPRNGVGVHALLPRGWEAPGGGGEEFAALRLLGGCSSVLALSEAAGAVEQVVALHDPAQNLALHREWPGLLTSRSRCPWRTW